jgi:hypothetical protein
VGAFEDPTPRYPVSNLLTRLAGFTESGDMVIRQEQVVDQIVEECRYLRNWHPRNGFNPGRYRQLVARIPVSVCEQLLKRGIDIWRDTPALRRWLDSSEAAPWRTSLGGV